MARVAMLRGPNCFFARTASNLFTCTRDGAQHSLAFARDKAAPLQGKKEKCSTLGEGEDEEIALARGNEGEETSVGGNGEVAEGEAMKDGRGNRLADGDVLVCNAGRHSGQRGEVNPPEVARFVFH